LLRLRLLIAVWFQHIKTCRCWPWNCHSAGTVGSYWTAAMQTAQNAGVQWLQRTPACWLSQPQPRRSLPCVCTRCCVGCAQRAAEKESHNTSTSVSQQHVGQHGHSEFKADSKIDDKCIGTTDWMYRQLGMYQRPRQQA
jgi:hypothetical protein